MKLAGRSGLILCHRADGLDKDSPPVLRVRGPNFFETLKKIGLSAHFKQWSLQRLVRPCSPCAAVNASCHRRAGGRAHRPVAGTGVELPSTAFRTSRRRCCRGSISGRNRALGELPRWQVRDTASTGGAPRPHRLPCRRTGIIFQISPYLDKYFHITPYKLHIIL